MDNPNKVKNKEDYASYYKGLPKKADWLSFYQQIELILKTGVDNFVEVGGGGWLVSDFFRRRQFKVTTIDLNLPFSPDVVASVDALPIKSDSTDCVVCCQVLEHLPLASFEACMDELRRITCKYLVMSLPLDSRIRRLRVDLPRIHFDRIIVRENSQKENFLRGYHFWELGRKGTSLDWVRSRLGEKWRIEDSFLCRDNTNHFFFLLEKKSAADLEESGTASHGRRAHVETVRLENA